MFSMLTILDLFSLGASLGLVEIEGVISAILEGNLTNLSDLILEANQLSQEQIAQVIKAPQKVRLKIIDHETLNF